MPPTLPGQAGFAADALELLVKLVQHEPLGPNDVGFIRENQPRQTANALGARLYLLQEEIRGLDKG